MRLHRFYTSTPIESDNFEFNDREVIHQWKKVFRYNVGSQVIVFDGRGMDYLCMISALRPGGASLMVVNRKKTDFSNRKNIVLCVGLIKKDNFEMVVQKAVELGVNHIVPVLCERSEKRKINPERLDKIIIESTEQSGRGDLMTVSKSMTIQEVLDLGILPQEKVAFHPDGTSFKQYKENTKQVSFAAFVGPEGGFSDKEIELFRKHNMQVLALGQTILRAETASIVVASQFLVD
ncbi:MAG: RsmE family RNA methyltransferase [Patescibacteria group bacterium]